MDYSIVNPKPVRSFDTTRRGQFKRSVTFENRSGMDIKVTYPTGEYVSIPTTKEQLIDETFNIYVTYEINSGCSLSSLREALGDREYDLIKDGLATSRKEIVLEYMVTDLEGISSNNGVFINNLSLSLTSATLSGPQYPTNLDNNLPASNNSFDLKIVVVDPSGVIAGQYMRFLHFVIPLQHTTGTCLPEGIYLLSKHKDDQHAERFDLLDDVELFRIFRTRSAAEAFEPAYASSELLALEKEKAARERLEYEREMSQSKAELENEKNRLDLMYKERNAELDFQKREYEHTTKLKEIERKDFYEVRSHVRKDTTEVTKWLPAVITAVGLVFSLL